MPVICNKDKEGCYCKWGDSGKKYYYPCGDEDKKSEAKQKAYIQGLAIGDYDMESYTDYPKAATNNAKRAIKYKDENGSDCGTRVGWTRARQLADRKPISRDTIARMASFKRHQQHKDVPYDEGCGGIMWDAWGGTEGIEWAIRKLEQIDNENFSILYDIIINEEFDDEIKYNLLEEHFKKYREKPNSTNVSNLMWDSETNELVVKFKNGDIYTYYDVPEGIYNRVVDGQAGTKTAGKHGDVGSFPSVGAAIHQYIIKGGFRYKKGGSLR